MASIQARQNRDGTVTHRVQFRIDGRMCSESFIDRVSAEEFGRLVDTVGGASARQVLEARRRAHTDMPTLRAFTARYLDATSGLLTGIEPGTRKEYERIAERSFLKLLGDYPVDAIDKPAVGKWVEWQERQPSGRNPKANIAPKTVRNYHALLSSILASAVDEKLRPDNPAYGTRMSKGVKHEGVFLTPDELATVLNFVNAEYEGLFTFLAHSGCRWGEATALTWGDVNLESRVATVRITKAWKKGPTGAPVLKQPKSRKAIRTIGIDDDAIAALGTPGPSDQLIFRGPLSGRHLWYGRIRERMWEPAVTKAQDVELCEAEGLTPLRKHPTIHDLRHSHASWLIAEGVPLPDIQARLGHEKITTTVDVYGHLVPDAHAQMAQVIGTRLAGTRPLRRLELEQA